jgi:hypothetical protein
MDLDAGQTVPLDDAFLETIHHHGREYQQRSLANNTYFEPIDEVRDEPSVTQLGQAAEWTRVSSTKSIGNPCCTKS